MCHCRRPVAAEIVLCQRSRASGDAMWTEGKAVRPWGVQGVWRRKSGSWKQKVQPTDEKW